MGKDDSPQIRKVIAAGLIGNVLEWYDFAIYGCFAASIGRHFFPHESAVAQLLAACGVSAVGARCGGSCSMVDALPPLAGVERRAVKDRSRHGS